MLWTISNKPPVYLKYIVFRSDVTCENKIPFSICVTRFMFYFLWHQQKCLVNI